MFDVDSRLKLLLGKVERLVYCSEQGNWVHIKCSKDASMLGILFRAKKNGST